MVNEMGELKYHYLGKITELNSSIKNVGDKKYYSPIKFLAK